MTPLKLTPKQEAFCLAYMEAGSPSEAYRRAYDASRMKHTVIQVKAAEVLRHPAVAARVKELQVEQERRMHERFELTRERICAEYAKIAYANMLDYVTVQEDGTAYVDLSRLTREQAAAISEITVDEYTEGRGDQARPVKRTKLKLHPKLGALDSAAKVIGIYVNKNEHTGKDGAPLVGEDASPRQLARVMLDILREAATQPQGEAEPEDED